MYNNQIDKFIDDNVDSIIRDTVDLINIPSVSKNIEKVTEALHALLEKGKNYGFNSYSVLDDRVGVIEFGEGNETFGILTHIDVVEAEEDGWVFSPFNGVFKDGEIWGRGAMDDKGPLISALYAMRAIKDSGLPIHKKVQLIIGTQEEVEWTDIRDYVKKYPLPDYGFTPDGEFPIENREKGYADVVFKFEKGKKQEGIFEIISLSGGQSINAIPADAKAIINGDQNAIKSWFERYSSENDISNISLEINGENIEITVEGVSAHSAFPERGINAITHLCTFLNTLSLSDNSASKLIDFVHRFSAKDFYGKAFGLYTENEYVNGEYMSRTVVVPTILETDDNFYRIYFNIRTAYGTKKQNLDKAFDSVNNIYKCNYEYLDYLEPLYISKEKAFLQSMAKSYERVSGLKNEFILAHGTSYAKAMPNIVAFGPVFLHKPDYCHEINERIGVDRLILCAKIYAHTLAEIVTSDKSFK